MSSHKSNNIDKMILNIDHENNSSFLDVLKLKMLQSYTDNCIVDINQQTKKRDILKTIQKFFKFNKIFSTRGVQGITGILNVNSLKNQDNRIVFKVSMDLDNSVEHENIITKELNKLRPYCPHFVGNIGMINLPISNDFIENPDQENLFKNSNDYFPCNVLLMEYVSPISLYHVCKYLHEDKSVIISLVCQSLMALDIAQQKCKLTQYDAHLDNILIRKIEQDSYFLYVHKGKKILIPTYGLYPVFIDMGSSYVKAVEGNPMYTSSDNYHNGLQPTLYDSLNDIHHLLTSVFYYLEDKGYVYDFLRVRFMYLFRHVPILNHKGWKQLPHNILDLVAQRIKKDCLGVKKRYKVYKDFEKDIIEILNSLIILPWINNGETSFITDNCMDCFLEELNKLNNMKMSGSEVDILYILRETIILINKYRDYLEQNTTWNLTNFIIEWKQRISFLINHDMKEIPKNFDMEKLIRNALKISEILSANYYEYIKDHVEICNKAYMKTSITCPLDSIMIILQNATPNYNINNNSKIYIWDTEKEQKTVIDCTKLTQKDIEQIDIAPFKLKGELLYNLLNTN